MQTLTELAQRLRSEATSARQRRLVVIEGDPDWTLQAAAAMAEDAVWLGTAPEGIKAMRSDKARRLLGKHASCLVLDLHRGVDADTVGVANGAVDAGGLLILRVPAVDSWTRDGLEARLVAAGHEASEVGGRWLRRFCGALRRAQAAWVTADGIADRSPPPTVGLPFDPAPQNDAIEALLEHDVVALLGDQGRGKSAALGQAAARLEGEVLLTGPGPSAITATTFHGPELTYVPPEDIVHVEPRGTLLIDEAAAVGMPTLRMLIGRWPRVALAATVHGYEGTGMGFVLALRRLLAERAPLAQEIWLKHAVGWTAGDPVEAFSSDALVLDPRPARGVEEARADELELSTLDRDALDDDTLRELLGLLIVAHYRTRPSDVRRLLDGPNMSVRVARWRGKIVAAALLAHEGGLTPAHAAQIHEGRTRPRGHLIPETLIAHLGDEAHAGLTGLRIVRIATHPDCRDRGIGAALRGAILEAADTDWVGTLAGLTERRVGFFLAGGLKPVNLSPRRGRSSGLRSALMLRGLTPAGEGMVEHLRRRFSAWFADALPDAFRDEDPARVSQLLDASPALGTVLEGPALEDAVAVGWGPRRPESARGPVALLLGEALRDGRARDLSPRQRHLLIERFLQCRPWRETLASSAFGTETPTLRALRSAVQALLLPEPGAAALATRFPDTQELAMSVGNKTPINPNRAQKIRDVVAARWTDLELVLDDVWDPHNIAAVLRSADAFGVGRAHLLFREEVLPDLPTQTSGGVKRWMDLRQVTDPAALVADLRRRGLKIVATALREDAKPVWDVDFTEPTALVLGNEHAGVGSALLDAADECVVVPMAGMAQSLNISVCGGVVLSEIGRQRRGRDNPWDDRKQALLDEWMDRVPQR